MGITSQRGEGMMQALLKIGDFVDPVDLSQRGPCAVPIPQRWFILRVHPNRESRVIRTFRQRGISAYLPLYIRTIDRKDRRSHARKPHLGRRVVSPLVPGLIFIPDFEFDSRYITITAVDDVAGFLQFGDFLASLSTTDFATIRAIEAHLAIPRGQRKYRIGDKVRFVDGPFSDFVGIVDRLDSRGRLRVFLDAVQRGVPVIATETQVEPADPATQV
jgi:transcription termination/antitermination protein NusG